MRWSRSMRPVRSPVHGWAGRRSSFRRSTKGESAFPEGFLGTNGLHEHRPIAVQAAGGG